MTLFFSFFFFFSLQKKSGVGGKAASPSVASAFIISNEPALVAPSSSSSRFSSNQNIDPFLTLTELQSSWPAEGQLVCQEAFFIPVEAISPPVSGLRVKRFNLEQGKALTKTIDSLGRFHLDCRVFLIAYMLKPQFEHISALLRELNCLENDYYLNNNVSEWPASENHLKLANSIVSYLISHSIRIYVYCGQHRVFSLKSLLERDKNSMKWLFIPSRLTVYDSSANIDTAKISKFIREQGAMSNQAAESVDTTTVVDFIVGSFRDVVIDQVNMIKRQKGQDPCSFEKEDVPHKLLSCSVKDYLYESYLINELPVCFQPKKSDERGMFFNIAALSEDFLPDLFMLHKYGVPKKGYSDGFKVVAVQSLAKWAVLPAGKRKIAIEYIKATKCKNVSSFIKYVQSLKMLKSTGLEEEKQDSSSEEDLAYNSDLNLSKKRKKVAFGEDYTDEPASKVYRKQYTYPHVPVTTFAEPYWPPHESHSSNNLPLGQPALDIINASYGQSLIDKQPKIDINMCLGFYGTNAGKRAGTKLERSQPLWNPNMSYFDHPSLKKLAGTNCLIHGGRINLQHGNDLAFAGGFINQTFPGKFSLLHCVLLYCLPNICFLSLNCRNEFDCIKSDVLTSTVLKEIEAVRESLIDSLVYDVKYGYLKEYRDAFDKKVSSSPEGLLYSNLHASLKDCTVFGLLSQRVIPFIASMLQRTVVLFEYDYTKRIGILMNIYQPEKPTLSKQSAIDLYSELEKNLVDCMLILRSCRIADENCHYQLIKLFGSAIVGNGVIKDGDFERVMEEDPKEDIAHAVSSESAVDHRSSGAAAGCDRKMKVAASQTRSKTKPRSKSKSSACQTGKSSKTEVPSNGAAIKRRSAQDTKNKVASLESAVDAASFRETAADLLELAPSISYIPQVACFPLFRTTTNRSRNNLLHQIYPDVSMEIHTPLITQSKLPEEFPYSKQVLIAIDRHLEDKWKIEDPDISWPLFLFLLTKKTFAKEMMFWVEYALTKFPMNVEDCDMPNKSSHFVFVRHSAMDNKTIDESCLELNGTIQHVLCLRYLETLKAQLKIKDYDYFFAMPSQYSRYFISNKVFKGINNTRLDQDSRSKLCQKLDMHQFCFYILHVHRYQDIPNENDDDLDSDSRLLQYIRKETSYSHEIEVHLDFPCYAKDYFDAEIFDPRDIMFDSLFLVILKESLYDFCPHRMNTYRYIEYKDSARGNPKITNIFVVHLATTLRHIQSFANLTTIFAIGMEDKNEIIKRTTSKSEVFERVLMYWHDVYVALSLCKGFHFVPPYDGSKYEEVEPSLLTNMSGPFKFFKFGRDLSSKCQAEILKSFEEHHQECPYYSYLQVLNAHAIASNGEDNDE